MNEPETRQDSDKDWNWEASAKLWKQTAERRIELLKKLETFITYCPICETGLLTNDHKEDCNLWREMRVSIIDADPPMPA